MSRPTPAEAKRRAALKRVCKEMETALAVVVDNGVLGVPDWAVEAQAFLFRHGDRR